MISEWDLLFIEPRQPVQATPIVDAVTRRMTRAFRFSTPSLITYCGVHVCICGAHGETQNYFLPNNRRTNSLCIHYVAYHRTEVPDAQLREVADFTWGEAEPSKYELTGKSEPSDPRLLAAIEELRLDAETRRILQMHNIHWIAQLVRRSRLELLGREKILRQQRIADCNGWAFQIRTETIVEEMHVPENGVAEIEKALLAPGLALRAS